MATHRFEAQLAAATPLANLLTGSRFEQLPYPGVIRVFAVQDNADPGDLILDMTVGSTIEIDNAAVPTVAANTGPNRNEHYLGGAGFTPLDRLVIRMVNNDAVNASNYRVLVDIQPL